MLTSRAAVVNKVALGKVTGRNCPLVRSLHQPPSSQSRRFTCPRAAGMMMGPMATTTGEYRAASTTLQVCTSKHDATHTGDGTTLTPKQEVSVHDVTQAVRDAVIASGVRDGSCHLLAKHTTVGLTLNESEARLERDYEKWLLGLAPNEPNRYEHNDLDKRPERPSDLEAIQRNWVNKGLGTVEEFMALEPINAHAHLLASLLGKAFATFMHHGAKHLAHLFQTRHTLQWNSQHIYNRFEP